MDIKQYIKNHGRIVQLDAGAHLFRQGELEDALYWVNQGLFKAYYLQPDGKELVKSFIAEQNMITNLSAVVGRQACTFSLVALEPAELAKVRFDTLFEHTLNDLELSRFMLDALIQLAQKKERREYEFLCLDATTRYLQLKAERPDLLRRVTQNDIARYLGITPVALSRIKHASR
ncbi:Crp/Fnr family transcriptional regulator [Motilimonas eburnea]|uniref:Crp/Fnr family transcriptional regulator n=1 Tax=Motilimonas eburnea TaxID=1737488 RepID=UPI001E468C71|nr:Crp/Fnr family transcriptional regulator [Motilimonas eburnea]MCE2573652.1 Crp/Fnr family transcriptional regulator [Motilimonas eburnea]